MTETVKAVTGLNLEFSRFNLPGNSKPASAAALNNPDCNCTPSEAQYQFPLNWDTGPESLDVFFYPRNYSGSDLSLFIGNQGYSRNINTSYYNTSAYIAEPVNNSYTIITLNKTSNVFIDHPNIPKKRISNTYNTDQSFAVFYDTHLNISRKCWAGTGTLGGDNVLVIYTYSKTGISVILCYLGNSSSECIHVNDQAHGPHSVIIDLTPGTKFGSKSPFTGLEYYWFNDSFYYSLEMGRLLTYYVFSNSFNNYWNGWYDWGNVYGLERIYSNYFGNIAYLNTNYYSSHPQTSYANYVKDEPLAGTSNWYCVSGRPQSVYHNITDVSIPNWRETTQQEKDDAPKNFGTGIDTFNYIVVQWATLGAVNAIPEVTYTDCNGNVGVLQAALPARVADTEPDWENPFVYATTNAENQLIYTLSPLLNGWNYYYWGYNYAWYQNWYLRFVNNNPDWYPGFATGNPTANAVCYTYYYYYGYYGGYFNYYSYGPFSSGVWEINPDVPGAVAYPVGTPVNEIELDDGTTNYQVMELVDVKTVDVSWPMFGVDGAAYQAMYNSHCTPSSNPCGAAWYYPYKQIATIPAKYTKAVYKVSNVNVSIPLGTPNYLQITDDELENFPLEQVNRSYVTEPGYLRSTYYGTVEAKAKKIGRSNYSYFGNFCYSYGYDSLKYEIYPAPEIPEGEEPPADLIVSNCNEYTNYYYNWWYRDQRFLSLKLKSSYTPYFFGGVRPHDGLVYPPNLTEPTVRIFSTDPPDPEEFRDSNYPKYYFQEFDPSKILVSTSKLLSVPPETVTDPVTPDTKIYLPDYENSTTKTTILPRATSLFQTVAEQSEYFQCEYLKGEFNDWYYYFPPSFLSNGGIDQRLDFPEKIYDCENNLTLTIPAFEKAAFLFDPTRGEEQFRSAGTTFNYYYYYNNIPISYLDYPEITAAVYKIQEEEAGKRKKEYPSYLPGWVHMYGNQVYDYDYIPSGTSFPESCNYNYGISSIVMGGTDLCSPITLVDGALSACGVNYKMVEPSYSIMTGFEFYDAYDASRAVSDTAYEAALVQMTYHAQPIAYEFRYVTSWTYVQNPDGSTSCNPNETVLPFTWYTVMVDNVYMTGGGGPWGFNTLTGFTKSYYDVTLPVWGRISGLYFYNSYYNYWNPYGWSYNPIGGDTSFLDCELVVADVGYNARKQLLTGNNLASNYSYGYYGGFYNYYGYGNVQSLNISDLAGWGTSITFIDAGSLYNQVVPQYCGNSCYTPTASTNVYYFDLIPVGGNSFFYYYGFGFYGYNAWLTGETYCQTLTDGICTNTGSPVRLSPEFPEIPPYNPCDPADYTWVEPCTRFYS